MVNGNPVLKENLPQNKPHTFHHPLSIYRENDILSFSYIMSFSMSELGTFCSLPISLRMKLLLKNLSLKERVGQHPPKKMRPHLLLKKKRWKLLPLRRL